MPAFIHNDIASRCTEARNEGVVQVMLDLEKTARSRKLGFGCVIKPESG